MTREDRQPVPVTIKPLKKSKWTTKTWVFNPAANYYYNRHLLDFDYLNDLSPEDLDWLADYVCAELHRNTKKSELFKNASPELRRAMYSDAYRRSNDLLTAPSNMQDLTPVDELEQPSLGGPLDEAKVIGDYILECTKFPSTKLSEIEDIDAVINYLEENKRYAADAGVVEKWLKLAKARRLRKYKGK